MGSSGAASQEYSRIEFNKTNYSIISEASIDEQNQIYIIDGENVTKSEIDEFIKNWNDKTDVNFIKN